MAKIHGEKVDWLHTNGDLYVAVELNNTDEGAREINKDKAQPRLYRNIDGQSFKNAVIVDNGSVVQFKIRSRGPFGFGYRIYAGLRNTGERKRDRPIFRRDLIANRLYSLSPDEDQIPKYVQQEDIDRAYQDEYASVKPLIQVRNFPSMNDLASDDRDLQLGMMSCTVVSWGVYGYIDEDSNDFGFPQDKNQEPYTNAPALPQPARWKQEVKVENSPDLIAFGGGAIRLPLRRGQASQTFSSADMIREVDPKLARNYTSFAFLVAA